jgi:hypothetical protein
MSDSISLQTQLLLAAFAEPHRAVPAWARWRAESGWEHHLDFDAYLLLPRVYHNLGGRGVDDALFRRLKGVVKRNWAANTATLSALGRVAEVLQQSGMAAVLLPPCSLLLRDRSTALEPGTAIAYQMARRDAQGASRLLGAAGWRCVAHGVPRWSLPGYIAATSRICLRDKDGTTLDLQWVEALHSIAGGEVSHELHGRAMRSPGTPASIFLLIAGPGMGSDFCRLSRALLLLEKAPEEDGWRCLLAQLQLRDSPFLALVASLSPVSAMSGTSAGEREVQHSQPVQAGITDGYAMTFRGRLARRWQRYRGELGAAFSTGRAIAYLPGYLMGKWDVQQVSEILPRSLRTLRYYWRQRHTNENGQPR